MNTYHILDCDRLGGPARTVFQTKYRWLVKFVLWWLPWRKENSWLLVYHYEHKPEERRNDWMWETISKK
jgi:hypothetical protein